MTEPRHEERAHSRLGASSAYRWMNCPGSVRETEGLDSQSIYAAEGTAAHELAELVLKSTDLNPYAHDFIGREIQVGNYTFTVDDEMADAVQVYVDTVRDEYLDGDVVAVERRFSLEQVRQGMFGTNDFLRYRPGTKTLTVYDYKHGQGKPVDPTANPQLLYYALGAALNHDWPILDVELVIVQPRAPGEAVKRWSTDLLSLVSYAADLKAAADAAADPLAPCRAGDWCKSTFCPKAGSCDTLAAHARASAKLEFAGHPASALTPDEKAAILDEADLIEAWISSVRADAYRDATEGNPPTGFKLVEKRAIRKWVSADDTDMVARVLAQRFGIDEGEAFQPPKLKSPAQVEKLLPKAQHGELAQLYEKVSSGTTLVRETDRRAPATKPTAASDFGLEN